MQDFVADPVHQRELVRLLHCMVPRQACYAPSLTSVWPFHAGRGSGSCHLQFLPSRTAAKVRSARPGWHPAPRGGVRRQGVSLQDLQATVQRRRRPVRQRESLINIVPTLLVLPIRSITAA